MYQKVRGVVLHSIKYNDKNSIVAVFSRDYGRLSFMLPQSASKTARMRRSMFMPLSIIDIDTEIKPGKEIHTIKDAHTAIPTTNIGCNPVKNAIALFMTELIGKIINGSEESKTLYDYVETSVALLDAIEDGVANFHICFLLHLGSFLGIEPDFGSYRHGCWFDATEGIFTEYPRAGHIMFNPEEATALSTMRRISFNNMHLFRLTREQRQTILDNILEYYSIHNSTLSPLKSPEILRQLFT